MLNIFVTLQSQSRVLDGNAVDGQPLSDHYGVVQRFTRLG